MITRMVETFTAVSLVAMMALVYAMFTGSQVLFGLGGWSIILATALLLAIVFGKVNEDE